MPHLATKSSSHNLNSSVDHLDRTGFAGDAARRMGFARSSWAVAAFALASVGCVGLKTLTGTGRGAVGSAASSPAPVAAQPAFGSNLTCEDAMPSYLAYVAGQPGEQEAFAAYKTTAKKLASCGDYDALFGQLMARRIKVGVVDPNDVPFRLLEMLAKEGYPIGDKAVAYAKGNAFAFEGGHYTAAGIAAFMTRHKLAEGCGEHVAALGSEAPLTLNKFMEYFASTQCRPAGPAVTKLLMLDVPDLRVRACQTLGAIGDPAHKKTIAKFAVNDDAMVIKGLNKVYPVRDACSGALAKLKD